MTLQGRDAGVWKSAVNVYGQSGGVWVGAKQVWANKVGVWTLAWEKIYSSFVFAAGTASPYVHAYGYDGTLGSKYANPATLPSGSSNGISINAALTVVAVSQSVTPFISAYGFSNTGWGTKFSNPAVLPAGAGQEVAWRNSSDIAVGHSTTPFTSVYPFSGGFGTKYANPATAIDTDGLDVIFNPAGNAIIIGINSGTRPFNSYVWSAGFGTKYANPTSSTYSGKGLAFSPSGDVVAVATQSSGGFISAWKWSSGLGTKYAAPTVPDGDGYSVDFNTAGNTLITSLRVSPFLSAWAWTFASGFGTKYAAAAGYPLSSTLKARFNDAGNRIAISGNAVRFYPFTVGTGFGTLESTVASTGTSTAGLEFV